ncbi:plasma membrane fusion protein PRM1 [Scheffersomyces xylosifermentans]|uniref:plasma membrane fusion protein PRM1 n=1 Tax=Scheffersomyces xylosifermentans TaxID=1304137 RepID=UPI00315D0653
MTQFLTFNERVSQVYLNKLTLIFVILIVKVYLFQKSLHEAMNNIPEVSDCSLDDIPKKVSILIKNTVENNLQQLKYNIIEFLRLIAIILKNLIWFMVELTLGTYTCLLRAAVNGTTNFAIETSEVVVKGVNSTIVDISHEIEEGLDGLSSIINKVLSTASKISNYFSGNDDNSDSVNKYQQSISLSIGKLTNLSIPSSVLDDIDRLRVSPSFTDIENKTKALFNEPFTMLTEHWNLNRSLALTNITFPTMEPVQICSNGSEKLEEAIIQINNAIHRATLIALVSLGLCAGIAMIPFIFGEWRKWRRQTVIAQRLSGNSAKSPKLCRSILYQYDRPQLAYMPNYWILSYATTSYAVNILLIGLVGLVAVLLQFTILQVLIRHGKNIDASPITNNLEKQFQNSTSRYITQLNDYFEAQEVNMNQQLFGSVKSATTRLNSTLNEFMETLNYTVNDLFKNTPLSGPVNSIVYCTIGRKVSSVEKGLTWLNNHLAISIPVLDNAEVRQDINAIIAKESAPVGNALQESCNKVIALSKSSLWLEFVVSICFVGVWVLQILVGAAIVLIRKYCNVDPESETEKKISDPMALTYDQRALYGIPITNPYHVSKASSSQYTSSTVKF